MALEILSPNLLVVEGKDEELFFDAFINYIGLKDIQIMPIGGKEKLRSNLRALVSMARFSEVVSLNIVRDANANPTSAFQSIQDALRVVELPVPDRPLTASGLKPRVTVMILPNEKTPGMLEDVCMKAVVNDPSIPCLEKYFRCLQQENLPLPKNLSKAKVQAFLASRVEAGKRLGEAAQAGYWPWDNIAFDQIKDFLRQIPA
jgi:hypothetical protein